MRENDIERPSYLLPPKCDCPCETVEPACDCYSSEVEPGRDRCANPIRAQFTCECCKRNVPRCFRVRDHKMMYTCRDCEENHDER